MFFNHKPFFSITLITTTMSKLIRALPITFKKYILDLQCYQKMINLGSAGQGLKNYIVRLTGNLKFIIIYTVNRAVEIPCQSIQDMLEILIYLSWDKYIKKAIKFCIYYNELTYCMETVWILIIHCSKQGCGNTMPIHSGHVRNFNVLNLGQEQNVHVYKESYSKTCVKRPLKNRQNKDLNDKW